MNRNPIALAAAFVLAIPLASPAVAQTMVDFREAVRIAEPALMTVIVDANDQIAMPDAADAQPGGQANEDGRNVPRGRRFELFGPNGQPLNRFPGGARGRFADQVQPDLTSAAFAVDETRIIAFVGNADKTVTVRNASGDEFQGNILAVDHVTGLAVIKVDVAPASKLLVSAAETEPGMPVVAAWIQDEILRTDFGMVTTRAIATGSGVGRTPSIHFGSDEPMTGAPILDASGIVVGVLVPSNNGGLVSAPSASVLRLIQSASEDQPRDLKRGLIGIQFGSDGPLVQQVSPGSAAEQAGITAGDLIRQIDAITVRDAKDVVAAVASARAGDSLEITVLRGDQTQTLAVTLTEHPNQRIAQLGSNNSISRFNQAFELRDGKLVPMEINPGADAFPGPMGRFPMEEMFKDLQSPDGPLWRFPQRRDDVDGSGDERSDVEETLKELQRQMEQLNKKLDREK